MNDSSERSDEVREIMERPPSRIIMYASLSVLLIILLLLIIAANFSYNDIIFGRIVVTSKIPPSHIDAKVSGRLSNVFVSLDQIVSKGQMLAEIENSANIYDVQYVKSKITQLDLNEVRSIDSLKSLFPSGKNLGEIQQAYNNFVSVFQNYILLQSLDIYSNERKELLVQIEKQKQLLSIQKSQLKINEADLLLSEKIFNRNKALYKGGVISELDFEIASKNILIERKNYEKLRGEISISEITLSTLNKTLTTNKLNEIEVTSEIKLQLSEHLQNLKNEIINWELNYLLISPVDGKVTLFEIWSKNQNINIGETLFTIIPLNNEYLIGKVSVAVRNSAKIKVGNTVIIKLDNYPYQEWGSISGKVESISAVPKQLDTSYTIFVSIDNLTSSYGKEIEFKQEMQGSAEFIVEELSVLERMLYQLRGFFERKEVNL